MVLNILNLRGRKKDADRPPTAGNLDLSFDENANLKSRPSTAGGKEKKDQVDALRLKLLSGISSSETVEDLLATIRSSLPVDVKTDDEAFNKTYYEPPAAGKGAARTLANTSSDPKIEQLMKRFRKAMAGHGAHGIFGIARKFKILDDDGSGKLCFTEFMKGVAELKVGFDYSEMKAVFQYFDENADGHISYQEFLTGVRGELNARRKKFVRMAFNVLDVDGSGDITIQDIMGRYDASKHPGVIAGTRTKASVFKEFLSNFEGGDEAGKDGIVTPAEFERYYANVSASIDDDDYFELMIRNAWHISGGKGWCENTTNRRVLVTHQDGAQSVQEIKNDIDIGKDDRAAMMSNLQAQGIDAANISTNGSVAEPSTPGPPMSPTLSEEPTPASARSRYGRGAGASSIVFG